MIRLGVIVVLGAFLWAGNAQGSQVRHTPRERDRAIAALNVRVVRLEVRYWNLRERERGDRREIRALIRASD